MRAIPVTLAAFAFAACSGATSGTGDAATRSPGSFGLGRTPTPTEIAALDIDAAPDGHGLPKGRGTAVEGRALYAAQCQMCHGASGEGMAPVFPALVGRKPEGEGFPFASNAKIEKTIGNYWSHATTLYDYIRRAMPHPAPGSLTNDQVYALTAYLLAANSIIGMDAALDSAALVRIRMPYAERFVPDNRRGGAEVK